MAQPATLKFGAGVFALGDGATPTETFTKICGFTSMEMEITKDTTDSTVPDCADPDAAIWTTSDVKSQGWKMAFEGFAAVAAWPLIESAALAGISRSVRLYVVGAGTGGGTPDRLYAGKAHVTMKVNAKLSEKWQVSVEVMGDGPLAVSSVTIPVL